jgi:pimeloyl-ACP methyl ester carboxylesterase
MLASMPAATSRTADLDGPTHYLDFGGPSAATPLVAVHGLGGSHANWVAVGPRLAQRQRVLAVDLAGHGFTAPDHRRTDVESNQRLLDRFLREVAGSPVVLLGNSMGGLVSVLQAARHPETVSGLVLVDPALPGPVDRLPHGRVLLSFATYAVPGIADAVLARRRRLLTPEQQVAEVLELCCADPSRVPADIVEYAVEVVRRRQAYAGLDRAFLDAARSVLLALSRRERTFAHMAAVRAPVLLLHGARDRLVPVAAARHAARLHPHWRLEVAPHVGHVPQLEAPAWVVSSYRRWYAGLPGAAPAPTR